MSSDAPLLHIWNNTFFQEPAARLLAQGAAGCQLLHAPPDASAIPRMGASADALALLAQADVAFGQPTPRALLENPRIRWAHLTSAGYTAYDRDDLRQALRERGVALTTSSSVYDEPCAQHVAAMMLSLARQLPQCLDTQRGPQHDWSQLERRAASRLLNGQTVILYGFGSIARRLTEILRPLRLQVMGVRRRARGDEGVPILSEADADRLLGEADHVVNILPENDATLGFFDSGRFGRFKPGARFYNIGRGATVDQAALLEALQSGRLDAAYLDVTTPEPLPPEHALWIAPNCFISPHSGGGHHDEEERLVRHFLANLKAFETGGDLLDQVI